jgi:trans-AT polyketide synthase/acyltransferase/oxidoreductase domain-containing protein
MKVYVFPGQGSQKKGMGEALFERFPEHVEIASQTLGYDLKDLCLTDPDGRLGQTLYTQPCLFVVNALSFIEHQETDTMAPDFLAGHSLGEFNALFAAGAFDFSDGIKLVKKRAELMSQAKDGGMAAIINCSENTLREIISQQGDRLDIANLNSPNQIVISGPKKDIEMAAPAIQEAGATCIPLRVSAAFHSRHMQPAMDEFASFIRNFSFAPIKIPVISNVTAQAHNPDSFGEDLARQIASSVRWTETVTYLLQQGCTEFTELGPGNVLTKLITAIRKGAPAQAVAVSHQKANSDRQHNGGLPSKTPMGLPKRNITPTEASESNRLARPLETTETAVITGETLGSASFRSAYGLRYAYVSGSMYKGIASKELVVRMGKAGLLAFLGTGGLRLDVIEDAIRFIQSQLGKQQPYGMNLIYNLVKPALERETIDLYLRHGVKNVEASAYMQMTPALVYFRVKGLRKAGSETKSDHRILAKVSRPEVAQVFLSPPPERILKELLHAGDITPEQASLAATVPMADDVCVEADSAGHTDMGVASVLIPTIVRLRDTLKRDFGYQQHVHIGGAGGIGTPESAAAAFVLGAEFILTGSINQCTVEAGMSDAVKDMLQSCNVQDTGYAPAGDMFELGARVQVLKRGLFFPARANKLYDLWQRYDSVDDIDSKTRKQIEEKFFGRTFEDVYAETKEFYLREEPSVIEKAERSPKHKMALIFRWYFVHSMRVALRGQVEKRVDFQVHCGPAMGAFNQWVKGTSLEEWRNRHVDQIGEKLMNETASLLNRWARALQTN